MVADQGVQGRDMTCADPMPWKEFHADDADDERSLTRSTSSVGPTDKERGYFSCACLGRALPLLAYANVRAKRPMSRRLMEGLQHAGAIGLIAKGKQRGAEAVQRKSLRLAKMERAPKHADIALVQFVEDLLPFLDRQGQQALPEMRIP